MRFVVRSHLWIGLLGLLAFLISGQIMRIQATHELPDAPRLYFRYEHLGLMWTAALNLVLAGYLTPAGYRFFRVIQIAASCAMLFGPPLFFASFFFEPYSSGGHHPMAWIATVIVFAGVLGHSATGISARFFRSEENSP